MYYEASLGHPFSNAKSSYNLFHLANVNTSRYLICSINCTLQTYSTHVLFLPLIMLDMYLSLARP
jgi:hypothetical protein